ncbi:hypothetical protein GO013_00095 [Pseudodesulfovibrio sp. JC047]|uniref:hypothetical protein n=1 Tax=Pseudodesulfovibrio sp. JC047 TaxID=2683199 RepID=UPI0013D38022|nr:hypothetical protein [Pseudodesulfovibrio sp. JC047]NDV17818.1 hypothetical protein [Pseudodesulfovibrio sp. JC047]
MNSTYKQFGQDFRRVHIAIDEYYEIFRNLLHWVVHHHALGVEKMVERFDE